MKASILAVIGGLGLAALADPSAARDHPADALTVSGAWSRPTPPGAPTAVGYLTIVNHGQAPDRLVGAETAAAATLTLHSMSMDGGVMRMRPVPDGLTIAPKATVSLGPGSYHLMFEGLKQPFKAGDQVRAVLRFQHAGAVPIVFDVGDGPKVDQPMVMGPSSHMAMPMH